MTQPEPTPEQTAGVVAKYGSLTAAQIKAVLAGGTNNHLIAGSLEKKGVTIRPFTEVDGARFKFVIVEEDETPEPAPYNEHSEARAAEESDTIGGNDSDNEQAQEIIRLRNEFESAGPERKLGIIARLSVLGTVVYPEGTPEYETFRAELKKELKAWDPIAENEPKREQTNVEKLSPETPFMKTLKASAEVHAKLAPSYDPDAVRYEDIPKWTDDRLVMKYKELHARLGRHNLRGSDRRLSENRCQRVENEILKRGIQDRLR